jgi:hypothetical protein
MTAFLTPEWLDLLDAAARAVSPRPDLAAGHRLVLGQEVRDAPGGTVRYRLAFDADGVRVVRSDGGDADLTFVCDYATAADLAAGRTNAQSALMEGTLQVRGDVERLSAARDALLALGDGFARVREATEF